MIWDSDTSTHRQCHIISVGGWVGGGGVSNRARRGEVDVALAKPSITCKTQRFFNSSLCKPPAAPFAPLKTAFARQPLERRLPLAGFSFHIDPLKHKEQQRTGGLAPPWFLRCQAKSRPGRAGFTSAIIDCG